MCTMSTRFRYSRYRFSGVLKNVVGACSSPCAVRCREVRLPRRQCYGERLPLVESRKCISLRHPGLLNKRAQRDAVIRNLVHGLYRWCTSAPEYHGKEVQKLPLRLQCPIGLTATSRQNLIYSDDLLDCAAYFGMGNIEIPAGLIDIGVAQ